MAENKQLRDVEAMSLDELVEFFDNEDLGDLWDTLPEVEFTARPHNRKRLLAVNENLARELMGIARARDVSTESLVEMFLWEKVREAA